MVAQAVCFFVENLMLMAAANMQVVPPQGQKEAMMGY